ncbi:MAG: hypothetical protein WC783_03355 [Candidatus Paceibacterota bacterium]|jgi:hypothetical protein
MCLYHNKKFSVEGCKGICPYFSDRFNKCFWDVNWDKVSLFDKIIEFIDIEDIRSDIKLESIKITLQEQLKKE